MGISAVRFAVGPAITRTDIPALCAQLADLLAGNGENGHGENGQREVGHGENGQREVGHGENGQREVGHGEDGQREDGHGGGRDEDGHDGGGHGKDRNGGGGRGRELVECDVGGLYQADVVAVEAVARLRLTARRHGRHLVVVGAGPDLMLLFALLGLTELLVPGPDTDDP